MKVWLITAYGKDAESTGGDSGYAWSSVHKTEREAQIVVIATELLFYLVALDAVPEDANLDLTPRDMTCVQAAKKFVERGRERFVHVHVDNTEKEQRQIDYDRGLRAWLREHPPSKERFQAWLELAMTQPFHNGGKDYDSYVRIQEVDLDEE